jgi:hypothetical protein
MIAEEEQEEGKRDGPIRGSYKIGVGGFHSSLMLLRDSKA